MSLCLVDTSVWIEVMRLRRPLELESVVALEDVVTCLPIIQEVLQGIREDRFHRVAREAMQNLLIVESPMTRSLVEEAVDIYRSVRRQGVTVRSSVDCLITACALRHDLEVLHLDRDFTALARITGLRERQPRLATSC